MREVTTTLGELQFNDNVFQWGHIYTVIADPIFHEDDTTVTVKLGYPRRIQDDYEVVTEITNNSRRSITKYVK